MKCPCNKGCPNRSKDCHESCEAYLKYEAERNAVYQRRLQIENQRTSYNPRDKVRVVNGKYLPRKWGNDDD